MKVITPGQLANHAGSNEYISWYTGINCCGVTGTPIEPQLNITYLVENTTPQASNATPKTAANRMAAPNRATTTSSCARVSRAPFGGT